jgi:hypothetical protein
MDELDIESRKPASFSVNEFLLIIIKTHVSEKVYLDCLKAIEGTYQDICCMKKNSTINSDEEIIDMSKKRLIRRFVWSDSYPSN